MSLLLHTAPACLSAIHKQHHTHHHAFCGCSICNPLLQGNTGHRKWETKSTQWGMSFNCLHHALSCSGLSLIQNRSLSGHFSTWYRLSICMWGKSDKQSRLVWSIKLCSIQVPAEASKQTPRWRDKVKKHCSCRQTDERKGRDVCVLLCFGEGLTQRANVCQRAVMSVSDNCFALRYFYCLPQHGFWWVCFCTRLSMNRRFHRERRLSVIWRHSILVIRPCDTCSSDREQPEVLLDSGDH